MSSSEDPGCANEGCASPAEPGETYCASCCLERLLYDREERFRQVRAAAPAGDARERRA